MARIINGSLFVPQFNPTGNPGEWTFTNAIFENESDASGLGSLAVQAGYLLYAPAIDANSAQPVPGVVHRYRITYVSAADGYYISATIIWDEPGPEVDIPQSNAHAFITEYTGRLRYGLPPSGEVYEELPEGSAVYATNLNWRDIADLGETGTGPGGVGATGLPGLTGPQGVTGAAGDFRCYDLDGIYYPSSTHTARWVIDGYTGINAMSPTGMIDLPGIEYDDIEYHTEWTHNVSENNFASYTGGNGVFVLYSYDLSLTNPDAVQYMSVTAYSRAQSGATGVGSYPVSVLEIWNASQEHWDFVAQGSIAPLDVERLSLAYWSQLTDITEFFDPDNRVHIRLKLSKATDAGTEDHLINDYTRICLDTRAVGPQGAPGPLVHQALKGPPELRAPGV